MSESAPDHAALRAVSKLAEHVCPVCGAFARVWTLPPEDGWTMIALECSVCPARAAVRLPRAGALTPRTPADGTVPRLPEATE